MPESSSCTFVTTADNVARRVRCRAPMQDLAG